MKTNEIFLSDESIANEFIREYEYLFMALPEIQEYIMYLGSILNNDYEEIIENVWVHKSAIIAESADITGPCIIDEEAEIRHCAFIRGSAIVGKNSTLGNSCELKNSILFNKVEVPHFNYVGDSILGFRAHMGAGSITSNVKSDRTNVVIKGDEIIETGIRKVGAFLGDYVEIGCNSVLNPGTIIGPNSSVYPLTSVRGVIEPDTIVKSMDNKVKKKVRK